jgi:hypothetical protein
MGPLMVHILQMQEDQLILNFDEFGDRRKHFIPGGDLPYYITLLVI